MKDPFGVELMGHISVGGVAFRTEALPTRLELLPEVGLLCANGLAGQVVHRARWPERGLYEPRVTRTPGGDYLMLFPDGGHYGQTDTKVNDMLAYRSSDQGRTWDGPAVAFDIDYDQHGFIPLIPKGTTRIYAFGTQPIPDLFTRENGLHENAPIGFRYSDDDGRTWSEVQLIRPTNDPDFTGMSVMRMCETDAGTWIVGSHEADWSANPLLTRQYLLRSEDQGQTWELLPGPRRGGWSAIDSNRMDEGRPINLGGSEVYCMVRTPVGRLWDMRSTDDGRTWSDPKPTSLVHPDAPPMLFALSDGTLAAFHHNRYGVGERVHYGLTAAEVFLDRSEIWVAFSTDGGRSWSEPRFVLANALAPNFDAAFRNAQCSYVDMFADNGQAHIFLPHRWERVVHLALTEEHLTSLPTRGELLSG